MNETISFWISVHTLDFDIFQFNEQIHFRMDETYSSLFWGFPSTNCYFQTKGFHYKEYSSWRSGNYFLSLLWFEGHDQFFYEKVIRCKGACQKFDTYFQVCKEKFSPENNSQGPMVHLWEKKNVTCFVGKTRLKVLSEKAFWVSGT